MSVQDTVIGNEVKTVLKEFVGASSGRVSAIVVKRRVAAAIAPYFDELPSIHVMITGNRMSVEIVQKNGDSSSFELPEKVA